MITMMINNAKMIIVPIVIGSLRFLTFLKLLVSLSFNLESDILENYFIFKIT